MTGFSSCATFLSLGILISLHPVSHCAAQTNSSQSKVILAHYMPWYSVKTDQQDWGWHWTMNHFDPDQIVNGKPAIASHFTPLIGPYDSQDPIVLEYHLLTMKIAGIDGVIVDWYGLQDFRDYAQLHRATIELVRSVERYQMKFAICYEDQTIPTLIQEGRIDPANRISHAVDELKWMQDNWFSSKYYLHLDQRPVLLSFGQNGLTDDEWTQALESLEVSPLYFSLHHRRSAALGAFDWPIPSQGLASIERFENEARNWKASIPIAFPRFVDIYEQAKVSPSYGQISDQDGRTFSQLLERALRSNAPAVQIATWNDWGEGTIVEPSHEFGYRDLQVIQRLRRRHLDPNFIVDPEALHLPLELYQARRAAAPSQAELDAIATALAQGRFDQARDRLKRLAAPK